MTPEDEDASPGRESTGMRHESQNINSHFSHLVFLLRSVNWLEQDSHGIVFMLILVGAGVVLLRLGE